MAPISSSEVRDDNDVKLFSPHCSLQQSSCNLVLALRMAPPSSSEDVRDDNDVKLFSPHASEQPTDDHDDDSKAGAALGLVENRPTPGLEDYIRDILDSFRRMENIMLPAGDYLAFQKELNEGMRLDMFDWMIETHHILLLPLEILYQACYIFDRYLSLKDVTPAELQLVGPSALFMASKYHVRRSLQACNFAGFSKPLEESMIEKEKDILRTLEWNLNAPTTYDFMTMFLKVVADSDEEMQFAAFFFGELGLMDYFAVDRPPSLRAASALYTARCTLDRTPLWPDELKKETRYSEQELLEPAEALVTIHTLVSTPGNKLTAVYQKYAAVDRKAVALRPPATPLIEERKAACSSVPGRLTEPVRRVRRRFCPGRHTEPVRRVRRRTAKS